MVERVEPDVVHNAEAHRFEAVVDGETAVAAYSLDQPAGRIEFTHTTVPPALEGRGIGSALARAGLEYARAEGLEVVPTCPFIRRYIERHPQYGDLIRG